MPRSCSICTHLNRTIIDAALESGQSLRTVAGQFAVSKSSVDRHQKHCHMSSQSIPMAAPVVDTLQPLTDTRHANTPRLSLEAQEALAEYRNVLATIAAYEAMSERDWKRSPLSPGMVLPQFWRQVEAAKQRCLALKLDHDRCFIFLQRCAPELLSRPDVHYT